MQDGRSRSGGDAVVVIPASGSDDRCRSYVKCLTLFAVIWASCGPCGAPVEVVIGLVGGGETPFCGVRVGDRCVVSPFAALERGESTDPSGKSGRRIVLGMGWMVRLPDRCAARAGGGYLTQGMNCGAARTVTVSRALGLSGIAVSTGGGVSGAGDRRSCQTRRAR